MRSTLRSRLISTLLEANWMLRTAILAILLSAMPTVAISAPRNSEGTAQETVTVEAACERSIFAARSRLEQGRRVTIRTNIEDQSSYTQGYPEDSPLLVNFVMEGAAANSLMNSPQFLKAITANIVTSCESISAVTFGVNRTGWTSTFGLMANKQIKEFDCIEPGVYRDFLPYGSQICGL